MTPILIITHLPDKESAHLLSQQLVQMRLAACVSILAECTSVYRWEDNIETANEIPVLIKTQAQHYSQVERIITTLHPYELPEVIAVSVDKGLPAYLKWLANETSDSKPDIKNKSD